MLFELKVGASGTNKSQNNAVPNSQSEMSVEEVAMGFIRVANEAMCRPIRALTQVLYRCWFSKDLETIVVLILFFLCFIADTSAYLCYFSLSFIRIFSPVRRWMMWLVAFLTFILFRIFTFVAFHHKKRFEFLFILSKKLFCLKSANSNFILCHISSPVPFLCL